MAIKAKPGTKLVLNKATGKYKMVPVKGAAKTTPAKAAAPVDPINAFVQDEINRQVNQDQQLTNYTDAATGTLAAQMAEQNRQAAELAAKYKPTSVYVDPTLDAYNTGVVQQGAATAAAANQDQANSIAALISAQGNAGTTLLTNLRAAGGTQHRDYSRYMQGLKPDLMRKRTQELSAAATQKLQDEMLKKQMSQIDVQNQLAHDQFGASLLQNAADNAYRNSALTAQGKSDAARIKADAAKNKKPVDKGIYGFGADRDETLQGILAAWTAGQKPTTDKNGAVIAAVVKKPWRELWSSLTTIGGLNQDQAALLATKSSPKSIAKAKSGAAGVKAMLAARKVSPKVQAWIIKHYFGDKEWAKLNGPKKPKVTHVPAPNNSITGSAGQGTLVPEV